VHDIELARSARKKPDQWQNTTIERLGVGNSIAKDETTFTRQPFRRAKVLSVVLVLLLLASHPGDTLDTGDRLNDLYS